MPQNMLIQTMKPLQIYSFQDLLFLQRKNNESKKLKVNTPPQQAI